MRIPKICRYCGGKIIKSKLLQVSEENAHIGMMEMDDCERVIRLCRDYKNNEEAA